MWEDYEVDPGLLLYLPGKNTSGKQDHMVNQRQVRPCLSLQLYYAVAVIIEESLSHMSECVCPGIGCE